MSNSIKVFQHNKQNALILPLKLDAFSILKEWLSDIAMELGLAEKFKQHLLIVADEIFTNNIQYAHPENIDDSAAQITLEVAFDCDASMLILTFSDNGVAFDPLGIEEPDIHAPLEERRIGGLGIFLVKKLMDSAEYTYENGLNVLTLKKHCALSERHEAEQATHVK